MRVHDDIDVHKSAVTSLPATTRIAHAHLRISDLRKSIAFYRDLIGMTLLSSDRSSAILAGAPGNQAVLFLSEESDARPRDPRTPGLFHIALLYPDRSDLALVFTRLNEHRWPFRGFADHGVSEALYLADPDGNGIELYRDKPREEWPLRNGNLEMLTEPLDIDDLLADLPSGKLAPSGNTPRITIGHMHLQVSYLHKAEQFYHTILGFDVTQRNLPGALFLAAGGYHHHIGLNVWNSRGARPSPQRTLGLGGFALHLGDPSAAIHIADRSRPTPPWAGESERGFFLQDGDGLRIEILYK